MTCEACKDKFSGRPCRFCTPVPERIALDFAQAQQALQSAGVGFPDFIIAQPAREALNAQVAALIARAREEERGKVAPLVALVREWQEARKAKREYDFPICYDFGADPVGSAVIQREKDAEAALAAFDLGKEGA